ncbi:hypothetical protein L6164_017574 [Bauhinia variegata]|uniref:Uncharacterized protein n=1 Tax=Bauhinia variegata TaxID=167791 RepID=A0ACB9NBV0_BAUVA|nr:hypothetical protein L6164_017574 [Bauhinia variegata]
MSTFRQYTRDDSFTKFAHVQKIIPILTEYQIALAFARDYDENGKPTNGMFKPYWDTKKVTADKIIQFKNENPNLQVNVFISIGDRDAKYPFKPTDKDSWVSNATNSIEGIINDYFQPLEGIVGIGIDVYYEHVGDEDDFARYVGQLIKNLKEKHLISLASIAPSSELKNVYLKLYQQYDDSIDFVDYQFYNEKEPIPDTGKFLEVYEKIAGKFPPKNKILAGYSSVRKDWANLAPIVFFIAGTIIVVTGQAHGASIWDIDSGVPAGWELSLPFGLMLPPESHKST